MYWIFRASMHIQKYSQSYLNTEENWILKHDFFYFSISQWIFKILNFLLKRHRFHICLLQFLSFITLWTILTCFLRSPDVTNFLAQNWQWWFLIPSWTVWTCLLNFDWTNILSQMRHLSFFIALAIFSEIHFKF